jgi:hypothetical protein
MKSILALSSGSQLVLIQVSTDNKSSVTSNATHQRSGAVDSVRRC